MNASETDLWVFRDGKKSVPGRKLLRELQTSIAALCRSPRDRNLQLTALIQAGEIEAALADTNAPTAPGFAALTDAVAGIAFGADASALSRMIPDLETDNFPEALTISPPEGFAYYALQPLSFGDFARHSLNGGGPVAVIGIRSIGTTLSAVVGSALRSSGHSVERITVRPTGHPYDRVTQFDVAQGSWIARNRARRAAFIVVDEGPGRSGSTFLSVGEALLSAGVARNDVTFFGSREPDVKQLCARDAASRWNSFRFLVAAPQSQPGFDNDVYVGGGDWRKYLLGAEREWPACWPETERLKFLSFDRKRLFKFEGLGRLGNIVRERARLLHRLGFGPAVSDAGNGFTSYEIVEGRPLEPSDVTPAVLERIAQYSAMRVREFAAENECSDDHIAEMIRFNAQTELGIDIDFDDDTFRPQQLIFADGRMQAHEWIQAQNGTLLKVDATTHGDDHFFPGPTDIAWDIAGTVVEWRLDRGATDYLVQRFQQLTGDNLRGRLPAFVFAYTVVRMAAWKMALSTVIGSAEESRVRQAYKYYRQLAEQQLPRFQRPASPQTIASGSPALAA